MIVLINCCKSAKVRRVKSVFERKWSEKRFLKTENLGFCKIWTVYHLVIVKFREVTVYYVRKWLKLNVPIKNFVFQRWKTLLRYTMVFFCNKRHAENVFYGSHARTIWPSNLASKMVAELSFQFTYSSLTSARIRCTVLHICARGSGPDKDFTFFKFVFLSVHVCFPLLSSCFEKFGYRAMFRSRIWEHQKMLVFRYGSGKRITIGVRETSPTNTKFDTIEVLFEKISTEKHE